MAEMRGVEDCIKKLGKLRTRYQQQKALKPAYMAGAEIVRAEAARLAPVGRTGELSRGMVAEWSSRKRKALVGPSKRAFYGEFVERGTSKMPARPFLRPALDTKAGEVTQAIADGMRQIAEEPL